MFPVVLIVSQYPSAAIGESVEGTFVLDGSLDSEVSAPEY